MSKVARKSVAGNIFGMTIVIDPDLQYNQMKMVDKEGRYQQTVQLNGITVKTTITRADCPCPVCNNILWEFHEAEIGSRCSNCGWPKSQKTD